MPVWATNGRIQTACSSNGTADLCTTTRRTIWFTEFCENNNLRFCDIHSLRHLHASLLINAGVDVVAVSGDLGHAQVSTTSNIYCHMFQEAQAKVSDAVSNALNFNKKEPKVS